MQVAKTSKSSLAKAKVQGGSYSKGYGKTKQNALAADIKDSLRGAPPSALRSILSKVFQELAPDSEPSLDLEHACFDAMRTNLLLLHSGHSSSITPDLRRDRAHAIIASVPDPILFPGASPKTRRDCTNCNAVSGLQREYVRQTGTARSVVDRCIDHRAQCIQEGGNQRFNGNMYTLIRKERKTTAKAELYEESGRDFLATAFQCRNLGNQRYNKVLSKPV